MAGKFLVLTMYPTFRFQTPSDIPTFTLMVQNKTNHDIDFQPESIHAYFDERAPAAIIGQVMLKKGAGEAGALRLDIPVAAARTTFNFAKKTTSG
jgi:hypothetical protein